MRAEYKRAAFPGDLIIPRCARSDDDAFTVTLSAGDDSVFTVMEFTSSRDPA
jgi:hypothetical protein